MNRAHWEYSDHRVTSADLPQAPLQLFEPILSLRRSSFFGLSTQLYPLRLGVAVNSASHRAQYCRITQQHSDL